MQRNIKIFIVLSIMGLFFIPAMSYACKTHIKEIEVKEMSCCSSTKEQPHVKEDCEKECCKSLEKNSKDCSGKCASSSCLSSSNNFAATNVVLKYNQINLIAQIKTLCPIYLQPVYSSNVSSIWQPPKIS